MRPVVVQVYDYSLDGIIGEEGTEFFDYCRAVPDDPEDEAWTAACLARAGTHLVGRVTYEGMARHFPTATGPIADAMNAIPKVVFSRTLRESDWPQTTFVSGDMAAEIDKLRREDGDGGEILAHGGVSLVRELARLDLADEYRLTVFPYLAGTGQRLFADLGAARRLKLAESKTFANGVVALTYRRS